MDNPIEKIRKRLDRDKGDLPGYYIRDVATLLCEIDRLIAENDRLKTELTAATFNDLPF